jgi:hypothetical protein
MKSASRYAKAVVAVVGGTVTSALVVFPAGTTTYQTLAVVSAACTAVGVYFWPNK